MSSSKQRIQYTGTVPSWDDVALLGSMRDRALDLAAPACILDRQARFVDWNPSFDEIIARPLGLLFGQLASEAFQFPSLVPVSDSRGSLGTSAETGMVGVAAINHVLELPEYGAIECRTLAAPIADDSGGIVGCCLQFVFTDALASDRLWESIEKCIKQHVTWSRYGAIYDSLLLNFTDYIELQQQVTGHAGDAECCIDLGAGTGNSAFALLDARPQREVWAIENNEVMLRQLRSKARQREVDGLHIAKCDAQNMPGFSDGVFDAATMVNMLYAVEDPPACLREARRILKPGGILAISNPHRETRVDRLFERMREVLEQKGMFRRVARAFDDAWERHLALDEEIHRYTVDDLLRLITDCGLHVDDVQPAYVDAVVVIRARR